MNNYLVLTQHTFIGSSCLQYKSFIAIYHLHNLIDMLHSLNTSKSKKYGVSSSTPQFIDSHKPVEVKPPLVKPKHSIPSVASGIHVKNSFHEQNASFKTKAEKKSMSLEVCEVYLNLIYKFYRCCYLRN